MTQKVPKCSDCGLVKAGNEDQFNKATKKRLGLHTYCKACASKRNRDYLARDKVTGRKRKMLPYCIACKLPKEGNGSLFPKNSASVDGLNSECRQCVSKRNKAYRATHKHITRNHYLQYQYGITLEDFEKPTQGTKSSMCSLWDNRTRR